MRFLVESYNKELTAHKCKPLDCHDELSALGYSPSSVFLDFSIDGSLAGRTAEELIGKTIFCNHLQPFISIACEVVIKQAQ